MYDAARKGHQGADNLDGGMLEVAANGYLEPVEFFIEQGTDNLDTGLYQATKGGHEETV